MGESIPRSISHYDASYISCGRVCLLRGRPECIRHSRYPIISIIGVGGSDTVFVLGYSISIGIIGECLCMSGITDSAKGGETIMDIVVSFFSETIWIGERVDILISIIGS